MTDQRTILTDASVVVRLSEVGELSLLRVIDGRVIVPEAVDREVRDDPGVSRLSTAVTNGWINIADLPPLTELRDAANHLGAEHTARLPETADENDVRVEGDTALLAHALSARQEVVVASDDKPLRETCQALSIPVTGSIGILVRAVELGSIDTETAVDRLYAMDEVGERLSASLIRRGERLIEAADD